MNEEVNLDKTGESDSDEMNLAVYSKRPGDAYLNKCSTFMELWTP